MIERSMTINELEGTPRGKPSLSSHVVSETHRLRDVPLSSLSVEDLRLLVAQEIALDHIVPLALQQLQQRPLASGDFYAGDLLATLLRIPASFWSVRRDWRRRLDDIAKPVVERFSSMSHRKQEKQSLTWGALETAYEHFSRVEHAKA